MSDSLGEPVRGMDSLVGARVAVVGNGEGLGRTLGVLHRMGAACVVLEDPYQAVFEVCGKGGAAYGVVVVSLPSVYPSELAAISAIRKHSPGTKVLVAGAEHHVSLLAAALRAGATGIVTEMGVEEVGGHQEAPPSPPVPPAPPAYLAPVSGPAAVVVEEEAHDAGFDNEEESDARDERDGVEDEGEEYNMGDPVLTAEELHALLHDDGGEGSKTN